ncbi:MAG: metalloprotease TldD [Wenzhouxiangellaceae bacterium]
MNDILEQAETALLAPAGISRDDLHKVLRHLMGPSVEAGDLYLQRLHNESWVLEDGRVRNGNYSTEQGVGVRAISGEKTGFAYADTLLMPSLLEAAGYARAIARQGQSGSLQAWRQQPVTNLYTSADPLQQTSNEDKVELLRRIDAYARSKDPRITQVSVDLVGTHESILVAAIDGTLSGDVRPLVRMNIHLIAEHNGRRESGVAGLGGRYLYERLMPVEVWQSMVDDAVAQALVKLEAVDAPAGAMPVVLGPGWPGVLLHEAIGHGLEGDFNRKGTSVFSGRQGQQVASSLCTVVDDGTLAERRGSLTIDDEGTPSQCTTLIEEGRLAGYMQDKLNARLMGVAATGNGRRESFAHLPLPRMTNTYMLPGPHQPEDIIASVKRGIYAVNFGGGQVDITSGKFVFSASEAYLIENGRIGPPVRGATLIGSGQEVLNQVSMVGNDLALDKGIGVCGKEGQSLPVGVGQPTLLVDRLTVGGTHA